MKNALALFAAFVVFCAPAHAAGRAWHRAHAVFHYCVYWPVTALCVVTALPQAMVYGIASVADGCLEGGADFEDAKNHIETLPMFTPTNTTFY